MIHPHDDLNTLRLRESRQGGCYVPHSRAFGESHCSSECCPFTTQVRVQPITQPYRSRRLCEEVHVPASQGPLKCNLPYFSDRSQTDRYPRISYVYQSVCSVLLRDADHVPCRARRPQRMAAPTPRLRRQEEPNTVTHPTTSPSHNCFGSIATLREMTSRFRETGAPVANPSRIPHSPFVVVPQPRIRHLDKLSNAQIPEPQVRPARA